MSAALALHDVRVDLGGTDRMRAIDLAVAPGERVALVGVSGSGKSLLAAAIAGCLPRAARASGVVDIGGRRRDLAARARDVPPGLALVRQDSSTALHPLYPVGAQLRRLCRRRAADSGADSGADSRAEGVAGLLAAVGLGAELAGRLPGELSGGQRQRVAVAVALGSRAQVVIADEATTALDGPTQQQVLAALTALPAALVLITHDLAVAAEVCSRVVVLDGGRLVDDLPLERMLAGEGSAPTRALAADLPTVAGRA
ncbi:ATP-binding cassette domain-containing protein [Nocardioides sp.]|uniref:ATP-binding cassette domain-containing protein n=1 Tax=Nocardioides sp. TaxID=35761 RepID=UPI0035164F6D